jgi:hypothetical protein
MKIWNYVWISISMMLFFEFMGLQTGLSGIFDFFNFAIEEGIITSVDFSLSNFMSYLFAGLTDVFSSVEGGLFTTLIAGGITAGLIYTGKADIAIKAGFVGAVFAGLLPTLYFALINAITLGVSSWVIGILAMIFIPFTIGFLFASIEYVVGGNTD